MNQQVLLRRRPEGAPSADDFEMAEHPVGKPGPGEVLLKNLYLSIDPAIRGWMSDAKSYLPPIELGAPVRSGTRPANPSPSFPTSPPRLLLSVTLRKCRRRWRDMVPPTRTGG